MDRIVVENTRVTPMRRLLGITGYKGCGKSTVAKIIIDQKYDRFSFAGTLKAMLSVLGLSEEEINGSMKEKPSKLLGGKTPRFAMQTLGTEWARDIIDQNIWVNVLERKLVAHLNTSIQNRAVVDDVRFLNEAEMIRRQGGKIVKVVRPGAEVSDHQSEREIDMIEPDIYLVNDRDIDWLRGNVQHLFRTLT